MISVRAHDVDLKQAEALLKDELDLLEHTRRHLDIKLQATHLQAAATSARRSVDLLARIHPDSPELVLWCNFVAEAWAALFTAARRPERARWRLLGSERTLAGKVRPESLRGESWLTGFWLAWATRDAHALALLTQVPASGIVEWESFDRPLVQALQGAVTRSPETGEWVVKALELADPAKVRRTSPDWILDILSPVLACLVPIIDRDEEHFQAALVKLLNLRREHFANGRAKGADSIQHLSAEGVGLVAWAKTLGLTVQVDSPYLPAALVHVDPPSVIACPACVTPIAKGMRGCDGCGREVSDDELRFDFDEWLSLERAGCDSCGHRYPLMGAICPVCLTARRG